MLEKIRSRGYLRVVIRPANFVEERVSNISSLYPLLQKISVQLRGWDFPHLDPHVTPHFDKDWVEQASEWKHYLELWRFYQSGQFVDFIGMEEDWLDQFHDWPLPKDWKPRSYLGVKNAVFQFSEIFEFAARLSLTEAGDEQMHLEIDIRGLKGRALELDAASRRRSLAEKKAAISELPYKIDVSKTELITASKELALKPAVELFRRFGWDPSLDLLRDMQSRWILQAKDPDLYQNYWKGISDPELKERLSPAQSIVSHFERVRSAGSELVRIAYSREQKRWLRDLEDVPQDRIDAMLQHRAGH